LCDEEDEEDENEALKKSFNLSFIFDLFRAAMVRKKTLYHRMVEL